MRVFGKFRQLVVNKKAIAPTITSSECSNIHQNSFVINNLTTPKKKFEALKLKLNEYFDIEDDLRGQAFFYGIISFLCVSALIMSVIGIASSTL